MEERPDAHIWALCPYARTTTCYTITEREPHMIASGCRRWTCPACGPRKKAALVHRITQARPNKFLTLTCRHDGGPQHRAALMRNALPRLATELRKSLGSFEYVRLTEQCNDGYPHFHLLCRANYLPQATISELWKRLTEASIVDIRKCHGRNRKYVAKYLNKAQNKEGVFSRQRVSVSKRFWLPEQNNESEFLGWGHQRKHPSDYAKERQHETAFIRQRYAVYWLSEREPGDDVPEELQPIFENVPLQEHEKVETSLA